jgi:hypothetical protein
MLLVILGAGASYDSAPSRPPNDPRYKAMPHRPPLANELFDDRKYFGDVMNKYPQCLPIIPRLRHISSGSSVEKELQRLQKQAHDYPNGFCQLAAVRYYLQEILFQCPNEWLKETQSISNYLVLLDHIKRYQKDGERVCFVTFNYDTLLDYAFERFKYPLRDMLAYIKNDFMLVKIHGSVTWGRFTSAPVDIKAKREDIATHLIDWYAPHYITNHFVMIGECPPAPRDNKPIIPAIAIPVESKLKFECPQDHIDALKAFIPEVNKILIVGWRATEQTFLDLLRDDLQQVDLVTIVNGDKMSSEEAANKLRRTRLLVSRYEAYNGGFTDFFNDGTAEPFFGLS